MKSQIKKCQSNVSAENWEIEEDFHIPKINETLEINEFKIFSREDHSKSKIEEGLSEQKKEKNLELTDFKSFSKEENPINFMTLQNNLHSSSSGPKNHEIPSAKYFDFKDINITSELKSANVTRLSPQYSRNRILSSIFQKALREKEKIEEFAKGDDEESKKQESKFMRVMMKFYLVKKFISNLKENTGYQQANWLKAFHLRIMNDLSYFKEGKNVIFRKNALLMKIKNKFIKKSLEIFFNNVRIFTDCFRFFGHFKSLKLVILPTNQIKLIWDILLALLTIFCLILIPLEIAFGSENFWTTGTEYPISILLFVFLMDIVINFNTAYYNKGEMIVYRNKIFKNYFYGQFLKDILSLSFLICSQFFNYFEMSWYFQLTGFLYLLRVQNLSKIISRWEEIIFTDENTANIIAFIRLLFNIYLFAHWSACVWRLIGIHEESKGWISYYHVDQLSDLYQYIYSLYYVIVVINTVGFGDIVAQTIYEKVFMIFFINFACILFAYNINRIGMILHNMNKGENELKRMIHSINGYMKLNNIDFSLKIKIRNYLEYIWQAEKKQNNKETQEIINRLSKSLKEELLLNANGFVLGELPLFKNNFSKQSMRKIICQMKQINMIPGDMIFQENGTNDENLYIVQDGKVELFNEISQGKTVSLNILKKGDYFGEISFFTGFPRTTSAKSLSFSSLFVVKKDNFLNIIKENNEDYERFCFLKDRISLNKEYGGILNNCYSCKKDNHTILQCPLLHLSLSPERILEKYNFNIIQERKIFSRRKKKILNFRTSFKHVRKSAKKITCDLLKIIEMEKDENILDEESLNEQSEAKNESCEPSEQTDEISENSMVDSQKMRFIYNKTNSLSHKEGEFIEESNSMKLKDGDLISENKISVKIESKEIADENFMKKTLKETLDIDAVQSYNVYFPKQNIEKLIRKINRIVFRKERKMKTFLFLQNYMNSPKIVKQSVFSPKGSLGKIKMKFGIETKKNSEKERRLSNFTKNKQKKDLTGKITKKNLTKINIFLGKLRNFLRLICSKSK